jgi:phage terminase small subunit
MPNEIDRQAVEKDYNNGMKTKELAEKYGISINTLKSWIKRYEWTKGAKKSCIQNNKKVAPTIKDTPKKQKLLPISESEELSPQERLFCEIYDRGHNATQAYIKAYKATYNIANANAYKLVVKHGVKVYLEKLRQQRREAFNLEPFDIVERMMLIAFGNIGDYVTFGSTHTEDGTIDYVNVNESSQVDTSLIAEISQGKDGVRIKLNDSFKALEWCANYFSMNPNDIHRRDFDEKKLQLECEKLKILKQKSKTGMDDEDVQKINENIESMADLINKPVPNRVIENE